MTSNQNSAILDYLRTGRSLTPLGALSIFNCLRLAARIADLRAQGYAIETRKVRSGRKSWAEYRLPQGQAAESSDRGAASASPVPAPLAKPVDDRNSAPTISSQNVPAAAERARI